MSTTREMARWGIPDWKLESDYPDPAQTDDCVWRWEFLRRRPEYRQAWERRSAGQMRDIDGLLFPPGIDPENLLRFGVLYVADPRMSMSAASLQDVFGNASGFQVSSSRYSIFRYGVSLARHEAAGRPQRIEEIERLLLEELGAEDAGIVDYRFDLSRPLVAQIGKARRELLTQQEQFFGKRNTPRPRKQN